MEAEEKLATLAEPVSLLEPARTAPEIIDLLSSIPKEPQPLKPILKIFLLMDRVEYLRVVRPKILQDDQARGFHWDLIQV